MGSELATPGKQTGVYQRYVDDQKAEMSPVVGKSTLTERYLEQAPSDFMEFVAQATQRELAPVIEHAGKRFFDDGKFGFECTSAGAFVVTDVPGGKTGTHAKSLGTTYTLATTPGVWHAVRDVMVKKLAVVAPNPVARPQPKPDVKLPAPDPSQPHLDTMAIALAKIEADGKASNYYRPVGREHKEQVADMVSGADTATEFWCSGFSMWTLAKAGFDMAGTLKDKAGTEFWYMQVAKAKNADAAKSQRKKLDATQLEGLADDEYLTRETISMRAAVDGWKEALRPLRVFLTTHPQKACCLGVFRAGGEYDEALGPDGDATGARGAASAFEAFGLGTAISELVQKPGDFAQEWHKNPAGNYGPGHAFQVATVTAHGAAMFGEEGSPELLGKTGATGWLTNVDFKIDHTTKPEHVGEHVVTKAQRAEATLATAMAKGEDDDANGGIHVSGDVAVPMPASKLRPGSQVFYGRLASSIWAL